MRILEPSFHRFFSVLSGWVGLAVLVPSLATASDVAAGFDNWVTPPGQAEHDFATSPIPAGFFYPGSDPFTGLVLLEGTGAGCGGSDTSVERLADAVLPVIPSSDTVPIQIVQLSLVSTDPITVTGTNPPEQWDVDVTLAPGPQPLGTMTIDHNYSSGGTYSATLPVCPLFTFTRIGPPATVQLDLCAVPFPPVQVQTLDALWTHRVQLPLQCGPPNPTQSQANFVALGPHTGPHDPEPLEAVGGPILPGLGPWGIAVLLLVVTAVGVGVMARRAGANAAS